MGVGVLYLLITTITLVANGFAALVIANARGYDSPALFWIGFFIPIFGPFMMGLLPNRAST